MSEDWWSRWFRRGRIPFFRRWFFEEMDEFLREIIEDMEREFEGLSKTVPKELIRERVLPDGTRVKEWGPFVYGYSVTIGPDGKPKIREFGNIRFGAEPGRPRISVSEKREPLVDVMLTDGEVRVVAELPGIEKEDIKLYGTEKVLTISVDTPERKYYKDVELPAEVDPSKAKSSYKNGVLEVILPRKMEKPKGKRIKID